ncbi:hypothetical protein HYH03_005296 [Edaphochlamys debaryana]|uniref:Cyclic nucleotide-binding domain-containing protein n=1 Tax=Edaphochlamys debaryana TaxID=47281 RepID=A0A835Y7B9_9CHLO|nr:hypothetical protein HYH03_005296 [Edaphochlamys debaryana]|eukprot:KAG2496469.1 hypothetical protein HYH03_005296 [Edaphochlamys debaryana]
MAHKSEGARADLAYGLLRSLATSKPRLRTQEQLNDISDLLVQQPFFAGLDRELVLAVAYFAESKHAEPGECIISKGQPLEILCLLVEGSVTCMRYSTRKGFESSTVQLGPEDTWSEVALLHSSHPRKSCCTLVAGPQGCLYLQFRYSDYDALLDPRATLPMLPPENHPVHVPVPEVTVQQRRACAHALLCCCLRRLASRDPEQRTPEEATEIEPFLATLPAYKAYPSELLSCMATHARTLALPPGSLVYEHDTLADAQVTLLGGEVQLRHFGGPAGAAAEGEEEATGSGGAGGLATSIGISGASGGGIWPTLVPAPPPAPPPGPPPPGRPGVQGGSPHAKPPPGPPGPPGDDDGAKMSIRARLKKEREARKVMQRQLDDYVSKLDGVDADAGAAGRAAAAKVAGQQPGGPNHAEWTRMFMQKAMRNVEPMWKALHPADELGSGIKKPTDLDDEPVGEVAGLLGPAAAKAYAKGRQVGYTDPDTGLHYRSSDNGRRGSESGGPASPAGFGSRTSELAKAAGKAWRAYSVDGPETEQERKLRNVAMQASRIQRDHLARSRKALMVYDPEEADEAYGPVQATLTRGQPVGELSTYTLHSSMRTESAVAGPAGCELLLVDWEAYVAGVLEARAGVLSRSAAFLGALERPRLLQLAELCLVLSVEPGALLARQGAAVESLVVVQNGELQLLHEPAPGNRTRTVAATAQALTRIRNGRPQPIPVLSTLSQTVVPVSGVGGTGAVPSAFGGPGQPPAPPTRESSIVMPAPPGGPHSTAPPGPPPSTPGGGTTNLSEVVLHCLPLADLGVTGIVGESILGIKSGTAGSAANTGHGGLEPHPAPPDLLSLTGAAPDAPHSPHPPGGPGSSGSQPGGMVESKWPATVLATKPSVLLVVQKSVLYMAEFDFLRTDLQKFAADRQTWLGKKVEAAYREAAAPVGTPAVFAAAAAAISGGSPASSVLSPGGSAPNSPSLRKSMLSAATNAAMLAASTVSAALAAAVNSVESDLAGELGGGSFTGSSITGPTPPGAAMPGVSNSGASIPGNATASGLQRKGSMDHSPASRQSSFNNNKPAGSSLYVRSSSTQRQAPSKWDFLDTPTSAIPNNTSSSGVMPGHELAAEASGPSSANAPPLTPTLLTAAASFGRPPSASIPGPAAPSRTTSLVRQGPNSTMVRGMSANSRPTSQSMSPAEVALMEAGLDPNLAHDGPPGSGPGSGMTSGLGSGLAGAGSGSGAAGTPRGVVPAQGVLSIMPVLQASNSPFGSPRVRSLQHRGSMGGSEGASGGGSAGGSPFRASGTPPLPSSTANRRSSLNGIATGLPPGIAASLLDTGSNSYNGRPASPSKPLGGERSSTSFGRPQRTSMNGIALPGGPGGGLPARLESPTLYGVRRSEMGMGLAGTSGSSPATPHGHSVIPGLAALDAIEAAASSAPMSPVTGGFNSAFSKPFGGGRSSLSGTPSHSGRFSSGDALRQSHGSVESMRRSMFAGTRGTGGSMTRTTGEQGVAQAAAAMASAAEGEAALARSLVPRNQAGTFMVREGQSSSNKPLGARRVAGCF